MWIPKTEEELQQAIDQGIEESATFDAKQQIASKSVEIAKDFAAMANDGGMIIYGIGEENGQLKNLTPIDLVGVPEKLDQIARFCLQPALNINISVIVSEVDPLKGYIVVIIPPSSFAPHQVTVKQENRFYGRSSRGNIPLTEGDIARLYQRRLAGEKNRDQILQEAIKAFNIPSHPLYGRMYVAIKPTHAFSEIFSRIKQFNQQGWGVSFFNTILAKAESSYNFKSEFSPRLINTHNHKRIAEGWKYTPYPESNPEIHLQNLASKISLYVLNDGTIYLCGGRIVDKRHERKILFEAGIANTLVQILWVAGQLYQQAGFLGNINIGLLLDGIEGSIPYRPNGYFFDVPAPLEREVYQKSIQVNALSLLNESHIIAEELVGAFFIESNQGTYNPFNNDITPKP